MNQSVEINYKKFRVKITILILILLFSGFFFFIIRKSIDNQNVIENIEYNIIKISAPYNITVNNNDELHDIASSGEGTQLKPYVIESTSIDGYNGSYCILINNTNKFFIIRNCTLYNATYGIYLNNVSNAIINNNIIQNNKKSGLYLNNCSNIEIYENKLKFNSISAINLFDAHLNEIYLNEISDNKNIGIFLNKSNRNEITFNYLALNNNTGLYLLNSNNSKIISNNINYHNCAICLNKSNYGYITLNSGVGNDFTIIQHNCSGNFIYQNFIPETENKLDLIIIDFTYLLVIGIIIFIILFSCFYLFQFISYKIK